MARVSLPERPLQPPHRADEMRNDQYVPGNEDYEYDKVRQNKLDQETDCVECQFFIVNGAKCGRTSSVAARVERESFRDDACGPSAKYFKIIPVAV
jgi:hypothetical protein